MILHAPFVITSRLMAGVTIGNATISIGYGRTDREGRDAYDIWIDLPDGTEYHVDDIKSGCQGGSLQEGISALCSFLTAAVESYNYRQRTGRSGENEDLFEPAIVSWADQYEDEMSILGMTIEESTEPLIEE